MPRGMLGGACLAACHVRHISCCSTVGGAATVLVIGQAGAEYNLVGRDYKLPENRPIQGSNNTSRVSYCQTLGLVLRLRVDFVLPLSQQQQQQQEEEEPSPKSFSGGCTRRLKFEG